MKLQLQTRLLKSTSKSKKLGGRVGLKGCRLSDIISGTYGCRLRDPRIYMPDSRVRNSGTNVISPLCMRISGFNTGYICCIHGLRERRMLNGSARMFPTKFSGNSSR